MEFTAGDCRFLAALRVDPGTRPVPPMPTNDELAERIVEAMEKEGPLFDEAEPTIRDWMEHSDQVEKESAAYHFNWKSAQLRSEKLEQDNANLEFRNKSLRLAIFVSIAYSAVLMAANIIQWYWRK